MRLKRGKTRATICENRRNSGNIANSISVLLSEAALPPEQQGDAPMKTTLVGVAFAAFLVLPLSAQSQASEGPSTSRDYSQKKHVTKHFTKRLGPAYRGLNGSAWNFDQPASNAGPINDGLCSTAPDFCPDYHGSNGA
jgi:hypothetical protein